VPRQTHSQYQRSEVF